MIDDDTFAQRVETHRRELRVHCYRMLGSFDEAEDLVQEVFLRAWRGRDGFAGRSSLRTWLYRIATNACLDALDGRKRRLLPDQVGPPAGTGQLASEGEPGPWLQPFPDHLWEPAAPSADEPETVVVAKETMELAFLAAMQHLPPRQRAVVIMCDVLGWPARQTAQALDGSVASVNSALQRARATLREHLPPGRVDWAPPAPPSDEDRRVLRRYMAAIDRGDLGQVAELLRAMDRQHLTSWIAAYERAWRTPGTAPLATLFTAAATYRQGPYEKPIVGVPAIAHMWEEQRDGPDEVFRMTSEVIAVEGDTGVARVEVRYGEPVGQEYRDLWIMRFAEDGRCDSFEEWPFWPGQPVVATPLAR